MKNLLIVLSIAILAAGCSSGTTVADLPSNVTSSYRGSFQNTPGTQSGNVTIDIQDINGVVTGNIIFTSSGANCLRNSSVGGNSTGFNLNLTAAQVGEEFRTEIVEREPEDENGGAGTVVSTTVILSSSGSEGSSVNTLSNGNVQTRTTTVSEVSGNLNMQFSITNAGNTISGTYTTDGNICSNGTGSGSMSLTR